MFAKIPAWWSGQKTALVFCNDFGHTKFYPMESKAEVGDKLQEFIREVGGQPEKIVTDRAPEELGSKWGQLITELGIDQRTTDCAGSGSWNHCSIAP